MEKAMNLKSLFGLEGKNVVITGAGSGMGYSATKLLYELGANIYASIRNNPLDIPVHREIKADLGQPEGLELFGSEMPDEVEALFLCHGIADAPGNANALSVNLTNFFGYKTLTEALLPRIADGGSVTFISSAGGHGWRDSIAACRGVISCNSWDAAVAWYENHPDDTVRGYVFSKECQHVYVMSKVHAPEFIDRKIRLNALAPGNTLTGLTDAFNKSIDGDAQSGKAIIEGIFLSSWNGRWASKEEMGHPLVVMGSRICSYMSGQIIYFDYGMSSVWEYEDLEET
ncbi:SDR family oxidoreductase [Clostridia bacterium OttesenSCG-928-O13]|nr:SDR family oxidoreductase [Clostridia bacterium OttesenSCG-928-O13]